jgi:hypothetical protein
LIFSGGERVNFVNLQIDCTEVIDTMDMLAKNLTPAKANEMMRRTFMDAGRRVKHIMREDVPHEYNMTGSWISPSVGYPKASGNGVVIPIVSKRGVIGERFPASGGQYRVNATTVHMKDGTTKQRKAHLRQRVIQAKILRGEVSVLPANMPSWQGGQPPFRHPRKSGIVFTRWGKERYPIHRVVGVGVPQPPINRSEDEVRRDLNEYLMNRLEHHFWQMFR